ncbi:MAG TPA: hypothetical protein VGN13_06885 [Solirubrobacteraceae bacterium]|jgi:O-antigen/teichoic acid export membrane protein
MSQALPVGAAEAAQRQRPSAHLLRGAYSLLANTAVTSVLGMGFWVLAAHLYATHSLGRDAALIAVLVELSTICQLNLANGIARFLPDLGSGSARALGASYALTATVALLVGSLFALGAPGVSAELRFLGDDTALAVVFVGALALWGVFVLQDSALVATRRAAWLPIENGAFGLLKLAALPALVAAGATDGVFLAWIVPMALLIVPVNLMIFKRALPSHVALAPARSTLELMGAARAARFMLQDYLSSVFAQATVSVLPLIVIARLGANASAYFAMPFTIVAAFDTLAYGACAALVVEAALQPARLRSLARLFARRVLAYLLPAAAACAIAAPVVLLAFGSAYSRQGAGVLRLLLCASALRLLLALFAAICRAQGRGRRLAALELSILVVVLLSAYPLAGAAGIDGVALAWLAANAVACCASLVPLWRFLRAR